MNKDMDTYSFVLILEGISEPSEEAENALFESGCDDATLSFRDRIAYLDFERKAENPEEAVLSAIRDVESGKSGMTVARVEPADPVSPAEIARRLDRTRESVRLLINGSRGSGGFPLPIAGVTSKTMIWSWAEVSGWCYRNRILKNQSDVDFARFIQNINIALKLRTDPDSVQNLSSLLQTLHNSNLSLSIRTEL